MENKNLSYSSKSLGIIVKLSMQQSLNSDAGAFNVKKKSVAINMKIFLNYLQMISIISLFDLKWPYQVKNFILFQSSIFSISNQMLSIDCLLIGDQAIIYFQKFKALLIFFFFLSRILPKPQYYIPASCLINYHPIWSYNNKSYFLCDKTFLQ
jgi:hypothetical protein